MEQGQKQHGSKDIQEKGASSAKFILLEIKHIPDLL